MVYIRKKLQISTFRKLPFGARFWDADNKAIAPYVKVGRAGYVSAFNADGSMTITAANPLNFTVTRVQEVFMQHEGRTA